MTASNLDEDHDPAVRVRKAGDLGAGNWGIASWGLDLGDVGRADEGGETEQKEALASTLASLRIVLTGNSHYRVHCLLSVQPA